MNDKNKKHIIFYSGGMGSYATARRVIDKVGAENTILMFTDTLIEDDDLYRFLLETVAHLYNVNYNDLLEKVKSIPNVSHETMEDRKEFLKKMSIEASERCDNFIWLNDGRDPWDVFRDVKFLGNSRIAQCSHILKQKMSATYIKDRFSPDECILYLGIDWTEEHRTKAPVKHWSPYEVRFPMCDEPYFTKIDIVKDLDSIGIMPCIMYHQKFSHANCGGFCVRAGQGHFINLLEQKPDLYKYHEEKEKEMIAFLGKDVSILRRTRNKVKERLTLETLRKEYESKQTEDIDMLDIGGCGCFVQDVDVDEDDKKQA